MNIKHILVFALLLSILISCKNTVKLNKDANSFDYNNVQLDSIRLRQKEKANDSISKIEPKILMDFHLGMTQNEFRKAEKTFKYETEGFIELFGLQFTIYQPEFNKGKLTWFTLGSSIDVERINGVAIVPKHKKLLINRYLNRYGKPDLFLDKDYQECDSSDNGLQLIIWRFDKRVFILSLAKHEINNIVRYGYEITYTLPEEWDNHLRTILQSKAKQFNEEKELTEKKRKISSEI